jgi:hypothetical protein
MHIHQRYFQAIINYGLEKTRDHVIYTEVGSNYIPPLHIHTHIRLVQSTAV